MSLIYQEGATMNISTSLEPIHKPTNLFNLETGQITFSFKKQLDIVGVISKQFFTKFDPYHVLNVSETLKTNGCFQKDLDFYKQGRVSEFKINYHQAVSYLEERRINSQFTSSTIYDWKEKINCSGYEKELGSYEKAVIAWASSELNFQGHQAFIEREKFTATHIVWM